MIDAVRIFIVTLLLLCSSLCVSGNSFRRLGTENRELIDLVVVGGVNSSSVGKLLQKCEGDCDGDVDCSPGLVCLQRFGDEPIPGCAGYVSWVDFCYDPNDGTPDPTLIPAARQDSLPTNNPASLVPTTMPTRVKPRLQVTKDKPLGKCEGDCQDDSDCDDNLVCYQRRFDGPAPGCLGEGFKGINFCIEDKVTNLLTDDRFRLKLYWEKGYFWQFESFERKWCLRCEDNTCQKNDNLFLVPCDHAGSLFNFYNHKGKEAQVQVSNTNLCFEIDQDKKSKVFLGDCDSNNAGQIFNAGYGDFVGQRFELVTPSGDGCISIHHDPKGNEVIFRETCVSARANNASFWNKS